MERQETPALVGLARQEEMAMRRKRKALVLAWALVKGLFGGAHSSISSLLASKSIAGQENQREPHSRN
jgi:hypothetical protein